MEEFSAPNALWLLPVWDAAPLTLPISGVCWGGDPWTLKSWVGGLQRLRVLDNPRTPFSDGTLFLLGTLLIYAGLDGEGWCRGWAFSSVCEGWVLDTCVHAFGSSA